MFPQIIQVIPTEEYQIYIFLKTERSSVLM